MKLSSPSKPLHRCVSNLKIYTPGSLSKPLQGLESQTNIILYSFLIASLSLVSTPTRLTAARYPWTIDWSYLFVVVNNYLQESNARLGNCDREGDNGEDVEQVEGAGGEVGQVQAGGKLIVTFA